MKSKTIGFLILSSLVFSILDIIYYSNFVIEKGYKFYELISLKDLYNYSTSALGGSLTLLSIGPWVIIYILLNKKETI